MTIRRPLKGKVALVMGVASEESIAWAIAQELTEQGARVILGYQFRFHSRVMQLAPTLPRDKTILVNLSGRGDKDMHTVAQRAGIRF